MWHKTQRWQVCSSLHCSFETRWGFSWQKETSSVVGSRLKKQWVNLKCFGRRWSQRSKKLKPRYVGNHFEADTRMWALSQNYSPSWVRPRKVGFSSCAGTKEFLMGGPLYSEGTGLLLAGAGVFVVGFFVFCCIDHCWLRRDLRKADRWSIFPSSSNSNSASDSMYSPWSSQIDFEVLLGISRYFWSIFPSCSNSNSASNSDSNLFCHTESVGWGFNFCGKNSVSPKLWFLSSTSFVAVIWIYRGK